LRQREQPADEPDATPDEPAGESDLLLAWISSASVQGRVVLCPDAVAGEQGAARARDQAGEALDECQRIEQEMSRAITPGMPELAVGRMSR
jgi:hypothetical protein